MCFGGGDSPQAPVNPAPYPYAELNTKDARAPDKNTFGNESDTGVKPTGPATGGTVQGADTGTNLNTLKM